MKTVRPPEVILPWEEYRQIEELLGFDLEPALVPEKDYAAMRELLEDERREEALHAVPLQNAANRLGQESRIRGRGIDSPPWRRASTVNTTP